MSSLETRFEPMTTGRLLDRSFRIYFQNFPLMVGIAAFAYLPILAFQSVNLFREADADAGLMAIITGVLAFLISFVVVTPMAIAATTRAVSDRYLGNEVTIGAALKGAWGHVVTLLLTQLVVSLIVMVGFILLIVPGILWTLSYALVAPVAILETSDRSAIRRRSWALVEGNRGKVFVVLLVLVLLQGLFGAFLSISTAGVLFVTGVDLLSTTGAVVQLAVNGISSIAVYPLGAIAITLLYYDLRIRKEGFDLEMLSRAIGDRPRQQP